MFSSTRCSGNSAGLLRCRVTSPGKLSSAIVEFVAPLRLWHSLRPINGWFSRRESSGPARVVGRSRENGKRSFRDVQAMFTRVRAPEEESGRVTRASFLTVRFLDIPKGGWSNQSVGTGRSPACPAGFCKAFFYVRKDNLFVPLLFKLLSCLHIYTITTFVILLIHSILQPFIKV